MIDRYGAIYHHLLIVKFHCNENLAVITRKKSKAKINKQYHHAYNKRLEPDNVQMDMLHSLFVYFTETMATAARGQGRGDGVILWTFIDGDRMGTKMKTQKIPRASNKIQTNRYTKN